MKRPKLKFGENLKLVLNSYKEQDYDIFINDRFVGSVWLFYGQWKLHYVGNGSGIREVGSIREAVHILWREHQF